VSSVLRDDPEQERYEIEVDGELAGFSEYRGHGAVRAFTHTEIEPRFEGRGLASELIRYALDDIRAQGVHILPLCPFVKAFLNDHREYLDLVQPQHRVAFNLPEPAYDPSDRRAG
jgi:predicted GNAT family acetyltransferase